MSYAGLLIAFGTAAGLVGGCASAGSALEEQVDAPPGTPAVDAPGTPTVDAPLTPAIDAPITPAIDAPAPCTVMNINLLTNPGFDMTPVGTGWVQAPIDPAYPIITADGMLVQSAPNKAWMAGFARTSSDTLHQDVTVPAGTTALALTGYYEVRSGETGGAVDSAKIELVQTGGALIQQAFTKNNTNKTTVFTPLQFTFAAPHAGTTVRLRLSTASDATIATSFYFDSLALTATVCQ